jgi:hypothetical protein
MLKYRKESKTESIVEPVEISLDESLIELDKFPTMVDDEGSWLDFIYEDKDIQLIRLDSNLWYVDIPEVENGEFVRSLITEANTQTVKDALSKFSEGQDPSTLFSNLTTMHHKITDEAAKIPRELRSFAIKEEYMKDIACECGSDNFDIRRSSKEHIILKCSKCSKLYSLKVDIGEKEDNSEPVITFLPIK